MHGTHVGTLHLSPSLCGGRIGFLTLETSRLCFHRGDCMPQTPTETLTIDDWRRRRRQIKSNDNNNTTTNNVITKQLTDDGLPDDTDDNSLLTAD